METELIYIIDDHGIFLKGLELILSQNGISNQRKVFQKENELLNSFIEDSPKLLIADHLLTDCTGLELILHCKQMKRNLKTVLMSSLRDSKIIELCIQNSIEGCIFKSDTEAEIAQGIKTVLENGTYYSEIERSNSKKIILDKVNPFFRLTGRELEIIPFLAKGIMHKDIAAQMGISIRTVQNHCANISEKLGKLSSAELTREAYKWRIMKEE